MLSPVRSLQSHGGTLAFPQDLWLVSSSELVPQQCVSPLYPFHRCTPFIAMLLSSLCFFHRCAPFIAVPVPMAHHPPSADRMAADGLRDSVRVGGRDDGSSLLLHMCHCRCLNHSAHHSLLFTIHSVNCVITALS